MVFFWRKRDHRVILSGQRRKLEKGGQQWSRKPMDLLELLRKGGMDGDVDFLREALRVLVEGTWMRRCHEDRC